MDALVDPVEIRRFLTLLFEAAVEEHELYFCIFTLPNKAAKFFNSIDAAVEWCHKHAQSEQHVYCSMGLFSKPVEEGRGSASDVAGIVGFWTDIDVLDSAAHKGKDYPSSIDEARSISEIGGFKPSMCVNSGYGLHPYYLFKEPMVFETPEQRNDAAVLVARFNGTIQANAKARGKIVDSVHDLARVLRVAGTLNWKQKAVPRKVVLEAAESPRRYLLDDLEPCFVATEYVKSGAEMIGDVTNFVINPQVTIDKNLVKAILANNTELAHTWEMNRPDFKDQSPSSYDMSLANSFVKMGLDDQQIVDLLVYWRREKAKAPKNRVDYYQRTIGKCRASIQASEAMKVFDQPGEMPQTSDPTLLTASDRQKLLNAIRGALMINVQKFVQLNKDNAEYFIVLDNGEEFSVGRVSNITRFHMFRDRVLERCNVMIPADVAERWSKVVVALFSIIEKTETEDSRTQDRVLGYITDYLDHVKVFQEEEWEQALAEDYPMIRDGMVWINKRHFIRWCQTNRGIKMSEVEAERDFHLLEMQRRRHEGIIKNRTRRPWFWGLPLDDFNSLLTVKKRAERRDNK